MAMLCEFWYLLWKILYLTFVTQSYQLQQSLPFLLFFFFLACNPSCILPPPKSQPLKAHLLISYGSYYVLGKL